MLQSAQFYQHLCYRLLPLLFHGKANELQHSIRIQSNEAGEDPLTFYKYCLQIENIL